MDSLTHEEDWIAAPGGNRLFVRSAVPPGAPRARVLIVHGMGEHSSRYDHVVEALLRRGCRVCAFDMRGHGRSSGRRGDIERYSDLLDDLALVWERHVNPSEGPGFLYGHSLGGQIVINFVAEKNPAAAGVIVASPWLELAFVPGWWKLMLARFALRVWPGFPQRTPVNPARLSRDQAFLQTLRDLDLVHHRMSARMYFELMLGATRAKRHATEFRLPLLLLHGTEDPVTSPAATEEFFNAVPCADKTLHLYPDTLHETHNDICREKVIGDIVAWIDTHMRSPREVTTRTTPGC